MTVLVPIRKGFPRPGIVTIPRRRGMAGLDDFVLSPLDLMASSFLSALTGMPSALEIQNAQIAGHAANKLAATDPNTGIVNQSLLDSANAQLDTETNQVLAQSQKTSTGFLPTDLWDTALGSGPGIAESFKDWWKRNFGESVTGVPPSSTDWKTIVLVAGGVLVVGGCVYLIVRR